MRRLLAGLLLAGCAGNPAAPPALLEPPPRPVSAERVGTLASAAASKAGAVLYDGGACVELPDGRAFWTFGDTFFGERGGPVNPDLVRFLGPAGAGDRLKSVRGAVSHTGLLSSRRDFAGAEAAAAFLGEKEPWLPLPPEEPDPKTLRTWPMHGIQAGGRLLLFYGLIRVIEGAPPPFNFEVLGIGLAEGDPARPPLRAVRGPRGWRCFPADAPGYGAAVLQADMGITEGFDYVFGTKPGGFTNSVYVARVPHGREADPAAWRFGPRWAEEPSAAEPIFDDAPGDLSVSWNSHLRRFVAIHSCCFYREVVMRVADRPEGPWSAPTLLFEVPAPASGDRGFVYGGKEQVGLREEGGRVLHVSAVDSREGVPALWRVVLP